MSKVSDISYGFGKRLEVPYEVAVDQTKAALKEQGFGILTEIDMAQTLYEKLGVEFQPYLILGACNPPLAHQALSSEINVGLLLPCNVIVYQTDESSMVVALDPEAALGVVNNPALESIAQDATRRLHRALDSLPLSTV